MWPCDCGPGARPGCLGAPARPAGPAAGGTLCPEKLSGLCPPQAAVQRARALSQEGERLIGHKHYAVDSIRPKCHELRHLCDQFAADLERRRGLLGKSLELHSLLEAVGLAPPLVLQSHSHQGRTTGAG